MRQLAGAWLGLAFAAVAAWLLPACAVPSEEVLATPVSIWTSATGGSYHLLGEALARILDARIQGVSTSVVASGGSVDNVDALRRGAADVAIALGDVVYLAHLEDSRVADESRRRLRGIAVLYRSAVHVIVPKSSRVQQVRDLAGAVIGVPTGSLALQRQRTTQVLLEAHGLMPSTFHVEALTYDEVRDGFRKGSVHAGVFATVPPNPLLADPTANVRLIPFDQDAVERAREQYPFFQSMTMPANTHPEQPSPIDTVGIDNLLVCREDLDPDLVYGITKAFIESLADVARSLPAVRLPGPDLASATPIPLHPGAARYYRERELLMY
jgi:TRAP transporter TAXI family solute receptor